MSNLEHDAVEGNVQSGPAPEAALRVAEAANVQSEVAMNKQQSEEVLGRVSSLEEKTTKQRLDAIEKNMRMMSGMLQQLLQKDATPAPSLSSETAVVPPQQQQHPATPTTESARAKLARNLYLGEKAPRALADIQAFQRPHRNPSFSASESDADKHISRDFS